MNAISSFTRPEIRALARGMIILCRNEFGTGNRVSQGAVAFAEWLTAAGNSAEALVTALGGWISVQRLLADATSPGLDFSELLGTFTDGAVTSKMWLQPCPGYEAAVAELDVVDEAAERLGACAAAEPSLGALGTTPAGRLFQFRAVEDEPSLRQIRGLGIAFELSAPGLCDVRDACIAALADMRGGAEG